MTIGRETLTVATEGSEKADHRPAAGFLSWLAILPMLLWLLAFVLLPNLLMVVVSFADRDEFGRIVSRFSTESWTRVFERVWLEIFLVSFCYAALTTVLCLLVGYPVAWTIARAEKSRRTTLLTLVMIPFWTSFLVRAYGWITLLKEEGPIIALLESTRLFSGKPSILYTPTAVVIGLVHAYLPFMILPIYGSAEKLDRSLVEAAFDLGARPSAAFFRVVWPLTRPGVAAGVLLVFVPCLGMFAVSDLLGGARFPMIGNVIQNQFGAARDWPFGAALGTMVLVLFAVAFYFLGTRRNVR